MTNLIQYVPDNGVTDALGLVLTMVKQLAVGAFGGLEGAYFGNARVSAALLGWLPG